MPRRWFEDCCKRTILHYICCRQDTHSQYTSVQYRMFTSAERTSRAWLQGTTQARFAFHFCAPEKSFVIWCVAHVSSMVALTTSTSSSSLPLPCTTQEDAAQSVQQEQLREHPAHHAHPQAPSVDKLSRQESLWREDLQSGGNPRTTTLRCAEEEGPDEMQNLCREFTLLRSDEASRVRGWIRGNTKIGPVLDVKVCYHQRR